MRGRGEVEGERWCVVIGCKTELGGGGDYTHTHTIGTIYLSGEGEFRVIIVYVGKLMELTC